MPTVYILTNEAMPGLIKIGRTDNDKLDVRIKQLDTTGVPLPFECFYAVKVENATAIEQRLHEGLDNCRVRHRREFFETTPEQAKALLSVAEIMGGVEVTPLGPVVEDPTDTQALEKAHKRSTCAYFSLLGIEPGEKLQFKNDSTIECKVVNDSEVLFKDEVMSLTGAANKTLEDLGHDWKVSGPAYWCWHGKSLYELRLERE